jgi:crotonobetainyl-CoA:carnitine CoA-transferase CaiB-like acyl-CoA transferase
MRPFEGVRVIDVTHVLAGPFAAYQLAVLGADVIKVDDPNDPDQSRSSGSDKELNRRQMGTGFLTQASNKRAITLNLKTERGREILKKLVATADVFVENYRPGAFEALGLGYAELSKINPRLIYASFSAFGQEGPRGQQTAYDHVIQATSGIMAMTGTKDVHPVKFGSPAIDYATGMTGAFALSAALFQRERTGKGQRIDMAMLDVAMILMSSHLTAYLRNGAHPKPHGNHHPHATNGAFATKDGTLVMLGASNVRQQKRLWIALGRPDMAKNNADANRRRVGGIPPGAARAGVPCANHGRGRGRSTTRDARDHAPPRGCDGRRGRLRCSACGIQVRVRRPEYRNAATCAGRAQ